MLNRDSGHLRYLVFSCWLEILQFVSVAVVCPQVPPILLVCSQRVRVAETVTREWSQAGIVGVRQSDPSELDYRGVRAAVRPYDIHKHGRVDKHLNQVFCPSPLGPQFFR